MRMVSGLRCCQTQRTPASEIDSPAASAPRGAPGPGRLADPAEKFITGGTHASRLHRLVAIWMKTPLRVRLMTGRCLHDRLRVRMPVNDSFWTPTRDQ
jgi:hypothetical protein